MTFHHLDEVTGQQITGDTWQDLAPETYSASTYQQAVEGYTYSYASPDPFTVDGMGAPVEVTLYYTPSAPQVVNSTVTVHHVDAQTSQPIHRRHHGGSRHKHGDLFSIYRRRWRLHLLLCRP